MPADMAALIQRIEQAEASQQAPWIKRAVDEAWKAGWITDAAWHKAEEYLNAGALLDAAVSLVPSGWHWSALLRHTMRGDDTGEGHVHNGKLHMSGKYQGACSFAATPALALCAAALKAMEARDAE